jgi:DNA-binding MurR/RpiR family transcriptional regulator
MQKDLIGLISSMMPGFSKGQKLIARYTVEHYDKAAFMTAAKLGQAVGVSESTVVRFASELGFDGYPQFQSALQELIRNRLTNVQRLEITGAQIRGGDVLERVLTADIEKIRRTLEETSRADFNDAVEAILSAKTIYILGIRSALSIATFLNYYFNHIFDNVRFISASSTSDVFEQLIKIKPGDLFIGISFPRYSQRTIVAMRFARDRGATTLAITDSSVSPLAESADHCLFARSDMWSFVDSLVAPLSLVDALIVAVGMRRKEAVSSAYEQLERIWDQYDVYAKSGETDAVK